MPRDAVRCGMTRLVLVALLAAGAGGVQAQTALPVTVPDARASEPALSLREAQLIGIATGLALGATLARQPEGLVPALRPLRGADAVVTGSAAALYLGSGLFARGRSATDEAGGTRTDDINGFDRKVRKLALGRRSFEKRRLLDHLSSSTLMAALFQPMGMLLASDVPHAWARDAPVLAEAAALTLSVNAFVKHLARRSRPVARFCEAEKLAVPCPPDTRLSFYSGHTSAAFVAAVAGGTLADFHHLQNRKWIWASGLTLATATGALRVAADQHYATDVLTGIAAGTLAGWLIPKLHKPDPPSPNAAATMRPARPAAGAVLPLALHSGRSTAVATIGFAGGGPQVSLRWQW
jgi:membrane-associated phospholipid phosphatase